MLANFYVIGVELLKLTKLPRALPICYGLQNATKIRCLKVPFDYWLYMHSLLREF